MYKFYKENKMKGIVIEENCTWNLKDIYKTKVEFEKEVHSKLEKSIVVSIENLCTKNAIKLLKMVDVDLENVNAYIEAIDFYKELINELKKY